MEDPMATTVSSRAFNQDIAGAKRAARQGPVIITDRGDPAFVLMTHEDFCRLTGGQGRTMVDMLRQPEGADVEFEPSRLKGPLFRPQEL
jgi:prevent-host-death family protein